MTTGPATGGSAPEARTWRPTTAGILVIISGALSIIMGAALAAGAGFIVPFLEFYGVPPIATTPFIVGGILVLLKGVVEVIGGAYALRRRAWGLALAASILALFPSAVLGILSIIFVAISRREFEGCCQ